MKTNDYSYDPYEAFEFALQKACIERSIAVVGFAWDNLVSEFRSYYQAKGIDIHKENWDYDLMDELETDEILSNLKDYFVNDGLEESLLDKFLKHKIFRFSTELVISDPFDCDDCGSSSIYTKVLGSVKEGAIWDVTQSYGCYGGDSFRGTQDESINFIKTSLDRLISGNSFSKFDKKEVQKFVSNLRKVECKIPFKIPSKSF